MVPDLDRRQRNHRATSSERAFGRMWVIGRPIPIGAGIQGFEMSAQRWTDCVYVRTAHTPRRGARPPHAGDCHAVGRHYLRRHAPAGDWRWLCLRVTIAFNRCENSLSQGDAMKSAVVPAANTPWIVKEVPVPKPGENQVLIRIRASGLCYTDVHITRGHIPSEFPRTIGHEPVGDIVEIGPGVRTRQVGDRVGVPWIQASCGRCEWCQRGRPLFCAQAIGTGVQTPGSHAEYMLAFADATALLPDNLSYEQAAPIFCAGYTVWSGLRWADPKPAERVAVLGIGGPGHLGGRLSHAAGVSPNSPLPLGG